jgi:putative aldouronate transport system substrate-binding protein
MEHWGTAFWLQKSVLDHFGRAPRDLDEYFDFIREYMELNPTIDGVPTSGFEILTDGWRRFCIDNPPMFMAGHANWGPAVHNNGRAEDRWSQPWNKPYYQKLNEEFHRGTIQVETLTRTFDQYLAQLASGAVLGMSDQLWNFNSGLDPLRSEGRFERTYLPLDLTYPGVESNYLDVRAFTGNNGIIINRNGPANDPVRLIMYMDYIIQEDVQRFLEWGIEGEHWFYNSEGRMERPDEQRNLQRETRWRKDNLGYAIRNIMPKMQGTYSCGNSTDTGDQPEEYFASLSEYDRGLFERLNIKTQTGFMAEPKERPVYYPFWSMSWEDFSPEQIADQRITDVNTKFLSALVIAPADEFDALWDEYQAALEETGRQDLYDAINREIQVRLSAFGG